MKEYKKRMPILPVNFSILIYEDPLEVMAKFPNCRFSDDPRDFQGGMMEWEDRLYILLQHNKKLNHGHIAHECKHLVNRAFMHCGIKLDADNDEPECYFLTYVVNEVYKHLKL